MSAPQLYALLENPLPTSLPPGCRTAILCYGTCFAQHEPIVSLEIVMGDGSRHPVHSLGMPRPDVFHRLHPGLGRRGPRSADASSGEDPDTRSYRSGFWATLPAQAPEHEDQLTLAIAARLASGVEVTRPLGAIDVVHPEPAPEHPMFGGPGTIVVCMATFEPDLELFRNQVASLRDQTDEDWVCVISDDCSGSAEFNALSAVVADDPRFMVHRAQRRVGFYRNFERAMRLVPAGAELIALCDQDDRWHRDKLAALREGLGAAGLVYSDQRLVDAAGAVIRDTMWKGRRPNHTDLTSLLVANTITGAATMFTREILELALPFPDTPGLQFHDHWLGLVALAAGEIAYVDRPLYDYVQHRGAIFGDVTGPRPVVTRRASIRAALHAWRGGRAAYFLGYLARELQAKVLLARCGPRLTPAKRRALDRFLASAESPVALMRLATRSLRPLWGRDETLGSELELARAIVWRHALTVGVRMTRVPGRLPLDATFPAPLDFEQRRIKRWRAGA